MRHIWSVLCRNLLEDKTSGNASLIEVTERIGFRGDLPDERPLTLPFPFPMHIVSNWWRDDEDDTGKHPCRVRFMSPDQEELTTNEYVVNLEDFGRLRVFGQIGELPFTRNGEYAFEVSYLKNENWKIVARIPLEIVHEKAESEQQESEPTD